MKCLSCNKELAILDTKYGYLPCKACSGTDKPTPAVEMVPERIREDRKQFFEDTLQPFRDGALSKEYLDQYGTKGITVSEDDIKNAKYTWNDLAYYKK